MPRKPKAPSTVVKPSNELEWIAAMLGSASEYKLEAEVVWELCDIIRHKPDVSIEQATIQALAEWDL